VNADEEGPTFPPLDSEVFIIVDDISYRFEPGSQNHCNGIYKVTYQQVFDIVRSFPSRASYTDEQIWDEIDNGSLGDRWFRLSEELYKASLSWIEAGLRITTEWINCS
jgi:hypothetical protein